MEKKVLTITKAFKDNGHITGIRYNIPDHICIDYDTTKAYIMDEVGISRFSTDSSYRNQIIDLIWTNRYDALQSADHIYTIDHISVPKRKIINLHSFKDILAKAIESLKILEHVKTIYTSRGELYHLGYISKDKLALLYISIFDETIQREDNSDIHYYIPGIWGLTSKQIKLEKDFYLDLILPQIIKIYRSDNPVIEITNVSSETQFLIASIMHTYIANNVYLIDDNCEDSIVFNHYEHQVVKREDLLTSLILDE